jgi:NAD(P)-dependent dehydrogenase (short-subunit alcohol dehydrogenase family)
MEIQGQAVLVTGAASGMGLATAQRLADEGARLVLLDLNQNQLDAVADSLSAVAFAADVSDESQVESAWQSAVEACGEIRACVHCAGVAPAARMVKMSGADFNRVLHINLLGTYHVMRCAARHMIELEPLSADGMRGVIVCTASVAAYEAQIGQMAYAASKGGVVSMTLTAARELARDGVRVMTVAPGVMDTPMMSGMSEAVREALEQGVPCPSRLGTAAEFAATVSHIISNDYLNGSVIRLDGALRMTAK